MTGQITQTGIGLILIALSTAAYFKNGFPKLRSIGIFTGILLLGLSGWLLHLLARIMVFGGLLTSKLGALLFGVGGVAVLAAIVAVMVYHVAHGWHPRGSAKKSHFWVAAALAIMIVSTATPFAALNSLPGTVQQGISTSGG